MLKIKWNKVTWYSKLIAIFLGLIIFAVGIYLGMAFQSLQYSSSQAHLTSK